MIRRWVCLVLIFVLISGCSTRSPTVPKHGDWKHVTERPYINRGNLYTPQLNYDYDEIGYASWYGEQFHNRKTALGKIFDMDGLTVAHRTLPLPSVVRITNLENGKSVVAIVNDRGPFISTNGRSQRIVDVSRRIAELLGFKHQGKARVRVMCLEAQSIMLAKSMNRHHYGRGESDTYLVSRKVSQKVERGVRSDRVIALAGCGKTKLYKPDAIGSFIKKLTYAKELLLR